MLLFRFAFVNPQQIKLLVTFYRQLTSTNRKKEVLPVPNNLDKKPGCAVLSAVRLFAVPTINAHFLGQEIML
jgi:hypothetical protein